MAADRDTEGSTDLKYYLYASPTKADMLFDQLPPSARRVADAVEAEMQLNLGVLKVGLRKAKPIVDQAGLSAIAKLQVVCRHLESTGALGSVDEPRSYLAGRLKMKWGVLREYAASVAFFGAETERASVALIGSPESLVGSNRPVSESNHGLDYYMFKFLAALDSEGADRFWTLGASSKTVLDLAAIPYYRGIASWNHFMTRLPQPAQALDFVARTLAIETDGSHRVIIASPLYVAAAD